MKVCELLALHEEKTFNWTKDKTYVGDIDISGRDITTLKGAPQHIVGRFSCSDNLLTSLEGAPSVITGGFFCNNNDVTSLHDVHKIITEIRGVFSMLNNPIKSHVLGILMIKGLQWVKIADSRLSAKNPEGGEAAPRLLEVQAILEKYIPNRVGKKSLLECQSELLDAGLDEYAQL